MAFILPIIHPENHNGKNIFFVQRFFFEHRISKMELNSWNLCGVNAAKVDSKGCNDGNFSIYVPKSVEFAGHGIGFAPVKLRGDFRKKPLTLGDWEASYRAGFLPLNAFGYVAKYVGCEL